MIEQHFVGALTPSRDGPFFYCRLSQSGHVLRGRTRTRRLAWRGGTGGESESIPAGLRPTPEVPESSAEANNGIHRAARAAS